jgi:uncharacterized protein
MVIIDTGPLVSLFDASEPAHETCKATLKKIKTPLLTSWPVITEAFYLLNGWQRGQREFWDFIIAGGLTIEDIPATSYIRLRELLEKYADNPMDIADATLVILAEVQKIKKIFTLDKRDFSHYRPLHCSHFDVLP